MSEENQNNEQHENDYEEAPKSLLEVVSSCKNRKEAREFIAKYCENNGYDLKTFHPGNDVNHALSQLR